MANYKVEEVEGIGPVRSEKLKNVGINTTDALLLHSKTPKSRKDLAEKAGLSEHEILKFANMVDLFRINGIGSEYSSLLEAAGVHTVLELAQRNVENLTARLQEVNEVKKMTRHVPGVNEVNQWIDQAKTLPRVLEY